jgi:hypothetical protein
MVTTVMAKGRSMGKLKLAKAALLVATMVLATTTCYVDAQGTSSTSMFPSSPTRYPESNEVSQALQQAAVCDCSCEAVRPDGTRTSADELLKGTGAQMACSTCCQSDELLQAMSELLPESDRRTRAGRACNEQEGLLAIFLAPTCWDVQTGYQCQFPFIEGSNQIVIDCTTTGHTNDYQPWCVYDMEAWNMRGEGWGYCSEATTATPSTSTGESDPTSSATEEDPSSPSSSAATTAPSSDNLDKIVANLTAVQEDFLKAGAEEDVVNQVKNSGGLTPAGIAVVTVICLLVVGIIAGTGVVIWKLRNKIKQRRSSKFQQMDKTGAMGPAGPADKNITMTEL